MPRYNKIPARLSNRGYTFLELIIAVAVLIVLIMVAIPLYRETIDEAKVTADQANLVILNKVTQELKTRQRGGVFFLDLFDINDDCTAALEYLVQEGLLQSAPEPSSHERSFVWDRSAQRWVMGISANDSRK